MKQEVKRMKQFDTRWVTFPIGCLLAVIIGDTSLWTILPIAIGCFPLFLKY